MRQKAHLLLDRYLDAMLAFLEVNKLASAHDNFMTLVECLRLTTQIAVAIDPALTRAFLSLALDMPDSQDLGGVTLKQVEEAIEEARTHACMLLDVARREYGISVQ